MFKRIWLWLKKLFSKKQALPAPRQATPISAHPEWELKACIGPTQDRFGVRYNLAYEHKLTGAVKERVIKSSVPLSADALERYAKLRA